MGRNQYEDASGNTKKSLNRKLIPYNIIIAAIAIACVITLYVGDFWKISIGYQFSEDMMKELMSSPSGGDSGESTEGASATEDIFKNIDFAAISKDAKIEIGLTFTPKAMLKSVTEDPKVAVQATLDSAVGEIMDNVTDIINNIFKVGTKLAVAMAVESVNESIKQEAGEALTEDTQQIDLSGVDNIVDEMLSDNPDNTKIKADLISLVNTQLDKIDDISEEERAKLKSETETAVSEFYDNAVTEYGDENGAIKPANVALAVMGDSLDINVNEDEKVTSEDITNMISQKIMSGMDDNTIDTVCNMLKVLSYFLLIIMAVWALLAVLAILHIFLPKKIVHIGLARAVGWIPHVLFVGIPMTIVKFAPKLLQNEQVASAIGDFSKYISGFSVNFSSLTWVSSAGAVALMLISWFGYRKIRKQIRKY